MPQAARLADPIGHSPSMNWLLAGVMAGAAIAVAGVAIVGTGGLAAAAIVGGAAALGGGLGETLSTMSWAPKEVCGSISGTCSSNVFTNGRPAARANVDLSLCGKHPGPPLPIAIGSATVFINGLPAARAEDKISCGAVITSGSNNVYIGGSSVQTNLINPEDLIPGWVHGAMLVAGAGSAVVLGGSLLAIGGLAGGLGGGFAGAWAGGELFGKGSDGQKWAGLAGALLGGALGARGTATTLRLAAAKPVAPPVQTAAKANRELPEGIHPDARGVHGYMPDEGSRYGGYDFSNRGFVARQRQIRSAYLESSRDLEKAIATMRSASRSEEEVAYRVVLQRNSQKLEARALMTKDEVSGLEAGNMKRYGDPVGPTPQQLFNQYGSWTTVIEKSMQKDPAINLLLGLPTHD